MPLSPNQGPDAGGTSVTITGTNLGSASAVHFGTHLGTITANTPTSITVTSPAGCGEADVTVTTPAGTSNPLPFFYIGPPFKASLSPTGGPTAGGNTVTITGTGLATTSLVDFGGNTAPPDTATDTEVTVTVPAGTGPGAVSVTVITAGGTSDGLFYSYFDAPTITSLNPTSGTTAGGTGVTITGTNLTSTSSVTFDGLAASFSVIDATTVTASTPAHAAGAVDVVITTDGGSATDVGGFTYAAGPGI